MQLELVPAQIFGFFLVFSRIGSMVIFMPAFGEASVPPWVRLGIAFSLTAVLYPLVKDLLPSIPVTAFGFVAVIGAEVLTGLFIGGVTRLLLMALHLGGLVIAFQTGLGFAQGFDPSQRSQSAIVGTFLTLVGINLILAANLHHLLVGAMHDSYQLFQPGRLPAPASFAALATETVGQAFAMGIQLAAPFIVFGIIFNTGIGLLARLMPQVQIFFIAVPGQILLGFMIMGMIFSSLMLWYLDYFEAGVANLLIAR